MSELTQDEINAILAGIETDDAQIHADTVKKNRQDAMAGHIPPSAKGRKRSEEWKDQHRIPCTETKKEKIGAKARGRILGPSPRRGIPMAEETKAKLSAVKKGIESWNKGIAMTESTKDKQSSAKTKFIYHTPKGTFYTKREMVLAFPEYRINHLERITRDGLQGFSRTLK